MPRLNSFKEAHKFFLESEHLPGMKEHLESTNPELVKEIYAAGPIPVSSIVSAAGYIRPNDGNQFFERLVAQSVLLPKVDVIGMSAPEIKIPFIRYGDDILYPSTDYSPPSNVTGPDFSGVTLSSKSFRGKVQISKSFVEDNVEKENFIDLLMNLVAKQVVANVEKYSLASDTATVSPPMNQFDGWLKSTTITFNVANTILTPEKILAAKGQLSAQYMITQNLTLMVSPADFNRYRIGLLGRSSGQGYFHVTSDNSQSYVDPVSGIRVLECPLMPVGTALLGDPMNLKLGYWRTIAMETFYFTDTESWGLYPSVRFCANVGDNLAMVKLTNIGVGAP